MQSLKLVVCCGEIEHLITEQLLVSFAVLILSMALLSLCSFLRVVLNLYA